MIIIALAGLLVFGNGLGGDFVHDDILVLSHGLFAQPDKFFGFFSQPYFDGFHQAGLYRPLTQTSFAFNFLFGSAPFGFHLSNVLLHIVNSFLVFLLLKKLFSDVRLGFAAALLFLVLPIHVEAVTSIVGRAELLSFLFGTLALLLWLDRKYILSAVLLLSALLSKETAVAVPAVAFLLSRRLSRPWKWLLHYSAAVAIYFFLRVAVLGGYAFGTKVEFVFNPLAHVPFFERFFTALKVLTLYVLKVFAPYRLSADYSYDQIPVVNNLFLSPSALVGLGILALMVFAVYRVLQRKDGSVFVWGLVFFFLPYLVVSNLILPIGTIMAERLVYSSSLGAAMLLGLAAGRLSAKFSKRLGIAFLAALTAVYGFLTVRQNPVWASRESLLTDSFEKSPQSVTAKTEFGILMLDRDKELAKRLALEVYEKHPDYIQNLNLLAAVAVRERRFSEAEDFLERALELRPRHQNTLQNLSRVYFTLGKYQEAEKTLKVLVFEHGGQGNVIFYALVQARNGRFQESRKTIESFFGPEVKDESALKILKGDFEELGSFYIFGK